jgi:hypothetical protein
MSLYNPNRTRLTDQAPASPLPCILVLVLVLVLAEVLRIACGDDSRSLILFPQPSLVLEHLCLSYAGRHPSSSSPDHSTLQKYLGGFVDNPGETGRKSVGTVATAGPHLKVE